MEETQARFDVALAHHRQGDTKEAESIYRDLLATSPRLPDPNYLLANILHARGEHWQALLFINRAIASAKHPFFLNQRGAIFVMLEQAQAALDDLRAATRQQPDFQEAFVNLCGAYRVAKDSKRALAAAQRSVELAPESADAWTNYASVFFDKKDFAAACINYEKSIALNPQHVLAHVNAGKAYRLLGNEEKACVLFAQAAQLSNENFEAQVQYAHSLIQLNKKQEAIEPMLKALRAARPIDLKTVIHDASLLESFFTAANILSALARYDDTLYAYQRFLEAEPGHQVFLNNLAAAEFGRGNLEQAEQHYLKIIEANPDFALARGNLAAVYMRAGKVEQAIEQFWAVYRLQPDNLNNLGGLIGEKLRAADWEHLHELTHRITHHSPTTSDEAINTFIMLSVSADASQHLVNAQFDVAKAEKDVLGFVTPPPPIDWKQHRRIRVGYISYDYRNHPLAFLAVELFELHDRTKFEVFLYSHGPNDKSEVRNRIEKAADHFVDLQNANVVQMCDKIRGDEIEILIDLTGNTYGGKPQIMALRPAPAQATWLGFIGTTGSAYYDYIIADEFIIPESHLKFYSENPLWMPHTLQINDRKRKVDDSENTRAHYGLPETGVVFCNFNQSYKTQPFMFDVWMNILKAIPGSVLWLIDDNPAATRHFKIEAQARNVDANRLIFTGKLAIEKHRARYLLADLAFDTFPYNSGATASDCLWMGCPLITYAGSSMVSRMAGSLNRAAGIPDLITYSLEQYQAKAIELATHPDALKMLRARLLAQRDTSPLFDTPRFVKTYEQGLRLISQRVRAQQAAIPLRVPDIPIKTS